MDSDKKPDVTRLLKEVADGRSQSLSDLRSIVYVELRAAAAQLMHHERKDHTLQPTALVHDALLRLVGSDLFCQVENRALFYSAASIAMRRILVEHARKRNAAKRGGDWEESPLDDVVDEIEDQGSDLVELEHALEKLELLSPRQFQVIQLKFFGGLPLAEIAELLAVSLSTVEKDLQRARAFLFRELNDG